MGIDGSKKVFINFGQGLSLKVGFFLNFCGYHKFLANLRAGFFDKMLALSNKKSTFVLVSGFFGCCIITVLFKYYLKSRFLTKTAH